MTVGKGVKNTDLGLNYDLFRYACVTPWSPFSSTHKNEELLALSGLFGQLGFPLFQTSQPLFYQILRFRPGNIEIWLLVLRFTPGNIARILIGCLYSNIKGHMAI